MLLSFIIPTFNNNFFITECLKSIITNKGDYEIIIIDDGSTDKTELTCKKFLKNYKNIKYYRQLNKGIGSARNLGIKYAKGDFLYFLDSDDFISSQFISIVIKNLKKYNADILTFNCKIIYDNKKIKHPYNYLRTIRKNKIINTTKYLNLSIKNEEFCPVPWLYVFKSKFIKKKKIKYLTNVSIGEDNVFLYRILTSNLQIVYINEKLIFHRVHKNSVMNSVKLINSLKSMIVILFELVAISKKTKRFQLDLKLLHFFTAICFSYFFKIGILNFIKISYKRNLIKHIINNHRLLNLNIIKFIIKGLFKKKGKIRFI